MKQNDIQIRDPFIIPVAAENRYYLFGTTDKNCWTGKATGFDVYSSKDLIDWGGPNAAFRPETGFWADQNFWAPEVYLYNGKYYMFASFNADSVCRGTQILIADHPEGPFVPYSKGPVTPAGWGCLDGTLYIDENEDPWIIFCHEWLQVFDGEMCAMRLTKNLDASYGEPFLLFRASEAKWSKTFVNPYSDFGERCNVTDGPFIHKTRNEKLLMLWSTVGHEGYAIGIARSTTGNILGPWEQEEEPFFGNDGGHGMVFKTFEGNLILTIHTPNDTPNERPVFFRLEESNDSLILMLEKTQGNER